MINADKIVSFLKTKYPLEQAEKWDPVGFSYKTTLKVSKVLITLDLTKEVQEYAVQNNFNFIITHHPFWFDNLLSEDIKYNKYKWDIYNQLVSNKISNYAIHTNFDVNKMGTSFQIIKKLNLENKIIKSNLKYGRIIQWNKTSEDFIELLQKKFNFKSMLSNLENNIKPLNIGIYAGSGDFQEIVESIENHKVDLVVTSDINWSEWITYNHLNVGVIQIPHLIEEIFANQIIEDLRGKFHYLQKIEVFRLKQFIINHNLKGSDE